MSNQFRFPDGERSHVQDKSNEFVQNNDYLQSLNSKKRKRGSTDESSGDDPGANRGLVNGNANGNHVNGTMDSFGGPINASASNEYNNLSQLRHAGTSTHEASTTAHAALMAAQYNPQNPNMSFTSNGSGTDGERVDSSFDTNGADSSQTHLSQGTPYQVPSYASLGSTAAQVQAAREASNGGGSVKPQVGTEEWHKIRKDNHKEGMFCAWRSQIDIMECDAHPM